MLQWNEYVKIFIAVMVIVDPLGAIPLFLGLTSNNSDSARRRIARVASLAMAIILIVSCLFGDRILHFFGISMASFRVAGGILLLFLGIAMMHARQSSSRHTPEEDKEAESKESIAVVPLALPLLAGPGAINMVVRSGDEGSLWHHLNHAMVKRSVSAIIIYLT